MICVISQPRFFPGLHYLHRMMVADVFVVFDTVQFNSRHEENRAKLKGPQGTKWLTAPTRKDGREQTILETRVNNEQAWQRKAIQTLNGFYGKAPHFKQHEAEIRAILETPHERLTELDLASWEPALRLLGIDCRFVRASELPLTGTGPQLLLDICEHVSAKTYLSGAFGAEYLELAEFERRGIDVRFHEYRYPEYPQRFGDFVPYLSYLDVLFNAGLDRDRVLAGGA